jgi:hypothetical protein
MKAFFLIQLFELLNEILAAIERQGCEVKAAHETINERLSNMSDQNSADFSELMASEARLQNKVHDLSGKVDAVLSSQASMTTQVADLKQQLTDAQSHSGDSAPLAAAMQTVLSIESEVDALNAKLSAPAAPAAPADPVVPADPAPPVETPPAIDIAPFVVPDPAVTDPTATDPVVTGPAPPVVADPAPVSPGFDPSAPVSPTA